MTVIAWDGRTLAADKRAVVGGGIARAVTKVMRLPQHQNFEGPLLVAFTGTVDVALELRAWFLAGAEPAAFPKSARDDASTSLIVIRRGQIATYCTGPYPLLIEAARCAWGSGRDFAEAVMHLGYDARKAVEVACHFQTDCGNGIDVLELTQ